MQIVHNRDSLCPGWGFFFSLVPTPESRVSGRFNDTCRKSGIMMSQFFIPSQHHFYWRYSKILNTTIYGSIGRNSRTMQRRIQCKFTARWRSQTQILVSKKIRRSDEQPTLTTEVQKTTARRITSARTIQKQKGTRHNSSGKLRFREVCYS